MIEHQNDKQRRFFGPFMAGLWRRERLRLGREYLSWFTPRRSI